MLVTDLFASRCDPWITLRNGLHRFVGYYAGMPSDAEAISFIEQHKGEMERVVDLYYENIGINYGPDRFSAEDAKEYVGLLRKLCMRMSGAISSWFHFDIPPRIKTQIMDACGWCYQWFYPELLKQRS